MIKAIILVVSPRIVNLRIEPSVTTASTGPEGYGPPRRTWNKVVVKDLTLKRLSVNTALR
jgi:hypothetical protein